MRKNRDKSNAYIASNKFVNKIGRHHFAHLRALAEGVDATKSAFIYLGIEHGLQARAASQQTVDAIRAIARRNNERSWRLIGLAIKNKPMAEQMSLDDFVASRGLDDWKEDDVVEMYKEAFPVHPSYERRVSLRKQIVALISRIEVTAAETPKLSDMVSGWFDDAASKRFIQAGMINLGDLHKKISYGGRWYANIPGIGASKAKRIEGHLRLLLEGTAASPSDDFQRSALTYSLGADDRILRSFQDSLLIAHKPKNSNANEPSALPIDVVSIVAPIAEPVNSVTIFGQQEPEQAFSLLAAKSDVEASIEWVRSKAGSTATATVYIREAIRLMLWLKYERGGKSYANMQIEDCHAYLTFLQNIPGRWISKRHKKPFELGWAPFRDQLTGDSHKQTIVIASALFNFLEKAKYLNGNPWLLVNKKIGQKKRLNQIDSKAISSKSLREILDFLYSQPPSPELSRFKFILVFVSNVGLRSAELLSVKLKDFHLDVDGWTLIVSGKGNKERLVAVPDAAHGALLDYLQSRNIDIKEFTNSEIPLVGKLKSIKQHSLDHSKTEPDIPEKTIGYQALYKFMRVWFKRCVENATLPAYDKKKLYDASTHWLRHTFGTTAVERNVPYDVIQSQLGHTSIETVARVYGRASEKRLLTEISKAFN